MSKMITGEGFRTLSIYRLFFKAALESVRKRIADYEEERREWFEEGDGRSPEWVIQYDERLGWERRVNIGGKGYAFPYCIHGTSLWTDYDNICGGCEDSETPIQQAQGIARERFRRFNDRWDWVQASPGDLPYETRNELTSWAMEVWLDVFGKKEI